MSPRSQSELTQKLKPSRQINSHRPSLSGALMPAGFSHGVGVGLVLLLASGSIWGQGHGPGRETTPFRFAFSSRMFTDVDENDAKAALKVWGQTVAKELGIELDPEPRTLKNTAALYSALRSNVVDGVGMITDEYHVLSQELELTPIFLSCNGGRLYEEYVLLVHRDSKIDGVEDLRGRSLTFYQNARACLAPTWLDTLLVQKGFKSSAEFCGRVTQNHKLPRVVLSVFFRQTDACVVTRTGFQTMIELNPQTGKQLKIVATSPEMVPTVFCFRANYSSPFKDQFITGLRDLHTTPAGQQVLILFHTDKVEECPASFLQSTCDLLATHRRLFAPSTEAEARPPPPERRPKER